MSTRFCNAKLFAVVVMMVLAAGPLFGQQYGAPPPPPWDGTGPEPAINSQSLAPQSTISQPPGQSPSPQYFGTGGGQAPIYSAPQDGQLPTYPGPPPTQLPVYSEPSVSTLPLPSARPGWGDPFPDASRFWFIADYLLWWTKDAPLPAPLVTLGSAGDSVPGALGQPSTRVIYGDDNIGHSPASGFRLNTGFYFDPQQTFGIQSRFFELASQSSGFSAFSDDNGNPLIARPAIDARNGHEIAYVDSFPGSLAGGVNVNNWSRFFGWELNGLVKLWELNQFRLDGLVGFRYLNLTESLDINDTLFPLDSGVLTFLGQPVGPSSVLTDEDYYKTKNNFYGGQLGTQMTWTMGRWSIQALTKLALGASQERAIICGNTALYAPNGSVTTAPGGVLATTANIGDYYRSVFAVSPEVDLNLRFQISPRWTARFGYTFLYWSNVLRPGDQVNRTVSPNLVPSDSAFGTAGPNQPQYAFQSTSYWAQGLNFGLDFHF